VIDGDSLEVGLDGEPVEIRLIGLNAPERYGVDRAAGSAPTCNGLAATAALTELVADAELVVRGDAVDRYGRLLAFVEADGVSVTDRMLADGWGFATGTDDDLGPGGRIEARARMAEAAAAQLGLWGSGCGSPAAAGLAIGEVVVNPPGRDRDNLNDELVTVVNNGPASVDLSGWTIRDDTTGHRFPLAGQLGVDERLVIRSGAGSDSTGTIHLDQRYPVWSNDGETVVLVDPAGVIAAWAFID
jgi:micrococcal nuclease